MKSIRYKPKRQLPVVLCSLLAALFTSTTHAQTPKNIILNPDLKGDDFAEWNVHDKKHGSYTVKPNAEGGFVVETTPSSVTYLAFAQDRKDLKEGQNYRISFQIRGEPKEPFKFRVLVAQGMEREAKNSNKDDDTRHIYFKNTISPNAEWQDVSSVFTVSPIERSKYWNTPHVSLQCGSVNGKLFIRNLVMVETEDAPTAKVRRKKGERKKRNKKNKE